MRVYSFECRKSRWPSARAQFEERLQHYYKACEEYVAAAGNTEEESPAQKKSLVGREEEVWREALRAAAETLGQHLDLAKLRCGQLTKSVMDGYVKRRMAVGKAAATVKKEFLFLHTVLEYAVSRDLIKANPLHGYWRSMPNRAKKYPILTPDEIQAVYDKLGNDETKKAFYFILSTGCRFNDMAQLMASDVKDSMIHFREGKGGQDRMAPLPKLPFDLPKKGRCFSYNGHAWIQSTLLHKIHDACDAARVARIRTHDLRHMYATYALALRDKSVYNIQAECGWRSLAMVQRYADVATQYTRYRGFLPAAFGKQAVRKPGGNMVPVMVDMANAERWMNNPTS